MTRPDQSWTRADFARWFLDHDQVDEAARVLEPGDQLTLGRSDSLDLEAALQRRGLGAQCQDGQLQVLAEAAAGARKPPRRTTPQISRPAKKTA